MASILLIDDDGDARSILRILLQHKGYTVYEADNADAGLSLACSVRPDLVITELILPYIGGRYVVEELRAMGSRIPVIVYTTHCFSESVARVGRADARFLAKPVEIGVVHKVIEEMLGASPGI